MRSTLPTPRSPRIRLHPYLTWLLPRRLLARDDWTTDAVTPPLGTAANNLFINRKGDQTFTGGGGSDTFVWLARDAGTPGNPDTDTITDFRLLADGQSDKLDIKDLLTVNIAFGNLPKYVNLSNFSSTGSGPADSTRLSISKAGAFSDGANIGGLSDQVIVLQGVVVSTLSTLIQDNLIWQTTGGPILA